MYIKSEMMYLAMKQNHGYLFIGVVKKLRATVSCKYGLPINKAIYEEF